MNVVETTGAVRCAKLQSKYWILLDLRVMEVVSGDDRSYKSYKLVSWCFTALSAQIVYIMP